MSKAVRINQHGGPEELELVDVEVGEPGPGEIRIRHKAVGLNFIDVYQRSGLYQLPCRCAGHGRLGRRRGRGRRRHAPEGGRPRRLCQPAARQLLRAARDAGQVRVQAARRISFETGAAMMLKGLTAQYLLKRTLPQGGLQAGDFVLFHAAAGGVGLIACQWAKALGLQLIGTAGSDEKCALAKSLGAATSSTTQGRLRGRGSRRSPAARA
jgi:NADPH2:quinone reductase